MRIGGLGLIALGVFLTFAPVAVVVLRLPSPSSHVLSKAMGAIGFSSLVLLAGMILHRRSGGKPMG